MAKITKLHSGKNEPVNFRKAIINCVYLDGSSQKTYLEFEKKDGKLIKLVLNKHEIKRIIEAQENSLYEYKLVPRVC